MAQTAAHLVDHVIPHVPVRQWVLSLPIPLRLLLAAQPKLVTPVLQVVHRVITRHLLGQAGLKPEEAVDDARKDAFRPGCPRPTDFGLHPKAASSASGAVFRPGSAVFAVPSGRKKGV